MARTNIDIDDAACSWVMRRYGFTSKREAVNYALRNLVRETLTREQVLALRGIGWEGDLDAMRGSGDDVWDGDVELAPETPTA